MTINLFQTPEYKTLMSEHIYNTIDYLFSKNQELAVACEIKHITFSPELPFHIKENFEETVLFILSGYTLESAALDETYFTFEAGFGEENFGSTITVPLLAIQQLFVGDTPILLNFAKHTNHTKVIANNSMESLLKNPENKKFLSKKK